MDLIGLTEELIMAVAVDKELVAVKEFPSEEENTLLIQVLVSEEDMSRIIGKNGKVISAIRTLVQASSSLKENKLVKINVDSI